MFGTTFQGDNSQNFSWILWFKTLPLIYRFFVFFFCISLLNKNVIHLWNHLWVIGFSRVPTAMICSLLTKPVWDYQYISTAFFLKFIIGIFKNVWDSSWTCTPLCLLCIYSLNTCANRMGRIKWNLRKWPSEEANIWVASKNF